MGETFIIQRNGKQLRSIIKKKNGVKRISCQSRFMSTIKAYYQIKCLADEDCLRGMNPYVSAESAKKLSVENKLL